MRWESELIPILSQARQEIGGCEKVAMEVPSGYGVADLVFFEFNNSIVSERVKSGLSPIDHANIIRILIELQHYTHNESVNVTALLKKPSLSKNHTLTYLIDNNFLVRDTENVSSDVYRKGVSYENGLEEVVAIEAKLKDWKRGLYQAYRYRRYADKSYLAVYTRAINSPLKNIEEFKKFNVGLIEVSDSNVKVHYKPKKEKHSDVFMKAIAYESLLASQKNLFPDRQEFSSLVPV